MSGLVDAHLDHRRSYEDFYYVYPVISRRSKGVSIGVNLNPDKVCNFDCVYCEVDRKTPARTKTVDLNILEAELRSMIGIWKSGELFQKEPFSSAPGNLHRLNDIALSGDGEPTSHREFDRAVEIVVRLRAELCPPDCKIVLITDAAGLDREAVRRGLTLMDQNNGEVWAKLDAGTEEYYRLVNRSFVSYDRILKNLESTAKERAIYIQTLFMNIKGLPPSPEEINAYCKRLCKLLSQGAQIAGVQLYTIARPTPEVWATALDKTSLQKIAETIRQITGLPVEVFNGTA
ncbi:MAG: radical SAM protein [Verrucomicrobiota bacterium]|nr:radical SAM protein [Verrucomicrobiota bacterium]